jgi:hypothetical protein
MKHNRIGRRKAASPQPASASPLEAGPNQVWAETRDRFLAVVDPKQRHAVQELLQNRDSGGKGLRSWLRALTWRQGRLPAAIPLELINIYLTDPEAVPLFDCESCGLAIPVRPGRRYGYEEEAEHVYFRTCPNCGGRTGWYVYESRSDLESQMEAP